MPARIFALLVLLLVLPFTQAQEPREPIVYRVTFPDRPGHKAEIEATIPTGKQQTIEVMIPVWSPGFYMVQNYANLVEGFSARLADGTKLEVEKPRKNRWRIQTKGAETVTINYRLMCNSHFVTMNWVGEDHAVLNGPASFITLVEEGKRPHEVKLELPDTWKLSMTGLAPFSESSTHHYKAPDYEALVDCPIAAGKLAVNEFTVEGSKHYIVAFGEVAQWDGEKVVDDLKKIVQAHHQFWGQLPFRKYVFLLALTQGGGGLEHLNSTLINISPAATRPGRGRLSWLSLVCHEYLHAFNVKRLRPIELGPFDYEKEPRTKSLWVAEGLTSYFGDLLVHRAGLSQQDEYLGQLTGHIMQLQTNPGRLEQTLEQASSEVWTSSFSGVGGSNKTVSYYIKGPVVGFLLDAHIRKLTSNKKSLDDVMRLAYQRYSGAKGFTPEQFRETAEEVAGNDLKEWFRRALASTEELDYQEALEWYGLEFTTPDEKKPDRKWKLAVKANPTEDQKQNLKAWLNRNR